METLDTEIIVDGLQERGTRDNLSFYQNSVEAG
jgi:hypothetical protein